MSISRGFLEQMAGLCGCHVVDAPKRLMPEAHISTLAHIAADKAGQVGQGLNMAAMPFCAGDLAPERARYLRPMVQDALQALIEIDRRLALIERRAR